MDKQRGFEQVERIGYEIKLPFRATKHSAGFDFTNISKITIYPNETVMVKTGIKVFMKEDELLELYVRSSIGIKKHLMLANGTGIIDSDYYNNESNEGEISVPLYNYGTEPVILLAGERIAQGVFKKFLTDDIEVITKRMGGTGSTNKKGGKKNG